MAKKRPMNKTLRMKILTNVYNKLIWPQIEKSKNDFQKEIRELAIVDPVNLEANELYSRFKAKYPNMFKSDCYLDFRVDPKNFPSFNLDECLETPHYGLTTQPHYVFHHNLRIGEDIWKNFYRYVPEGYTSTRIKMDPPIIDLYQNYVQLLHNNSGKRLAGPFFSYIKKMNKEMKEYADLISGLHEILLTCKTVEQFIEGYPEFKEFIPEAELPMYPMVSVDTVNSTLKILKKIKAKK